MFDYILADEDEHNIALSRWTNALVDDQAYLDELARYQARKEQEFAEYSDWIVWSCGVLPHWSPPPVRGSPMVKKAKRRKAVGLTPVVARKTRAKYAASW